MSANFANCTSVCHPPVSDSRQTVGGTKGLSKTYGRKLPWEAFGCLSLFSFLLSTVKAAITVCQRQNNLAWLVETSIILEIPPPPAHWQPFFGSLLVFSPNILEGYITFPPAAVARCSRDSQQRVGTPPRRWKLSRSLGGRTAQFRCALHSCGISGSKVIYVSLLILHTYVP